MQRAPIRGLAPLLPYLHRAPAATCSGGKRGVASLPIRKSYDLVAIGSGPASQKCALDAAKKGKTVAIVDSKPMFGGVCVVRAKGKG